MDKLIIFISLTMLLISVICIYGARGIVKNKVKKEDENKVVLGMKIVCFVLAIFSLVMLCYFK